MTSSALELLALKVMPEQPENPLPYREGLFLFPADITVHRKVDLQGAKVSESIQEKFQDLCTICTPVFSNDLEDFGHIDLVTMDIETVDSLLISLKPYISSLKHTTWVQKR